MTTTIQDWSAPVESVERPPYTDIAMFIGGQWTVGSSGKTDDVVDPATESFGLPSSSSGMPRRAGVRTVARFPSTTRHSSP
jgi:hypothetical protein